MSSSVGAVGETAPPSPFQVAVSWPLTVSMVKGPAKAGRVVMNKKARRREDDMDGFEGVGMIGSETGMERDQGQNFSD